MPPKRKRHLDGESSTTAPHQQAKRSRRVTRDVSVPGHPPPATAAGMPGPSSGPRTSQLMAGTPPLDAVMAELRSMQAMLLAQQATIDELRANQHSSAPSQSTNDQAASRPTPQQPAPMGSPLPAASAAPAGETFVRVAPTGSAEAIPDFNIPGAS
jgi:hypothetical protein